MKIYKIKASSIKLVVISNLFFILCFFLTRQFPLSQFFPSGAQLLLFTFVFSVLIFNFKKVKFDNLFVYFLIFLSFVLGVSILVNSSLHNTVRFFSILAILGIVFYLPLKDVNLYKPFNFALMLHAIFLIIFEVYMLAYYRGSDYTIVRQYFLQNGFGDVYTFSGYFYKIQLTGNALIPFAFLLSYYFFRNGNGNGNVFYCFLYIIAIIIAGNFMFIVSVLLFVIIYEAKIVVYKKNFLSIFIMVSFFIMTPMIISYVNEVLTLKYQGVNNSSLGIRYEQAIAFINEMSTNWWKILFGFGLGSSLDVATGIRDYRDYIYFELQSLYFLYQIGFWGFLVFICIHLLMVLKKIQDKVLILIYAFYILYAITNPYIFDTTQIIVLIVLISISNQKVIYEKNINT